jgi:lipopolysaccharide biosynthesis glycosyltransferase
MKAQGNSMEIVFVHFGSKFPKHLILNLKRTCALFPDFSVVLITDSPEKLEIDEANFRMSCFIISHDYQTLNNNLSHPKGFRDNFWFTSLARIFALCDYVAANNVSILHIESDVLVSGDLPIDLFANCDRPIAFTVVGRNS